MQLLSANWLRAASRPLRDGSPWLYAALNGVRNRILSAGTGLSATQAKALHRFRSVCLREAAGARVLEIGSDIAGNVLVSLADLGVAKAVGVNPDEEIWNKTGADCIAVGERATLHRADARQLPFENESFDAIFSISAFEHILELPKALTEMHRVLRTGGVLYSHFGPIWSGCRGHHLRVQVGESQFRHYMPETNPLPDYVHLLLSRDRMRDALLETIEPMCVEAIVAWVYDDPGINRLFHHEYVEMFAASPFELTSLRPERDPVDRQLEQILRFRYPRERDFAVTNSEAILTKRA